MLSNQQIRRRLNIARHFPDLFLDGLYLPYCIFPLRIKPRCENPVHTLTAARASVGQYYGEMKANLIDSYPYDEFVADLNLLLGDATVFSRPLSHFLRSVQIKSLNRSSKMKGKDDWEIVLDNRSYHFRFLLSILYDRKSLSSYYDECRPYIEHLLSPETLKTFWDSAEWLHNVGRGEFKDFLQRKGIGHNDWLHRRLPDKYRFHTAYAEALRAIIETHYDATEGPKKAHASRLAAERETGHSRRAPLLPIRLCPRECLHMPWHYRKCPSCNTPTREICCHVCKLFFAGWLTRCPSCQSPISDKHCLYCGDEQGKEILSGSPLSESSRYYCPGCKRIHGTQHRSQFAIFNSSEPETTSPLSADGLKDKLRRFLSDNDTIGAALLVFEIATRPHQATQPDDAVRTIYELIPELIASTFEIPQNWSYRHVIKEALHPDDIGDWIKHQYLEVLVFIRIFHPNGLASIQDEIHLPPHVDKLDRHYVHHAAEEQRDAIIEAKKLFESTHDKRTERRKSEELQRALEQRDVEHKKQIEQHHRDRGADLDEHKKVIAVLQGKIERKQVELREVYQNQLADIQAAIKQAEQEPQTPETIAYIKEQRENEARILQRLQDVAD